MGTPKQPKRKVRPDTRGIKAYKKFIPDDVLAIIQDAQNQQEKDCKCNFSVESTVYLLIRKLKNL